ncbi:hypothetical protein BGZ60DRAFT_428066 [Tricladium varicosporioides]|nr:hypothetical protein BGZ60DRAFT_428066 [Hymenoscyphus varicosporioides]
MSDSQQPTTKSSISVKREVDAADDSLAKKQRVGVQVVEVKPSPVIFTNPGFKADLRLNIFNHEFHVASIVLKLNSAFFRRFLDPLNEEDRTPASMLFQYEWYTKIDDDGNGWTLTRKMPEGEDAGLSKFKGKPGFETRVFVKLLNALFSRGYQLLDCTELIKLAEFADYYCCLPIVSQSLYQVFYSSPGILETIGRNPCGMLKAAYRLRHKVLFKEAFIHVLGPWSKPRYTNLQDADLYHMADTAHRKMKDNVLNIYQGILQVFSDPKRYGPDISKQITNLAMESRDPSGRVCVPLYFRKIYDLRPKKQAAEDWLDKVLEPILAKKLVLDKTEYSSGEGKYRDFFLSIDVGPLPWDKNDIDW